MSRLRQHISLLLAAVLMLSVSCRKDEAEVIPRSKLAEIYAEMLVTDQWITTTPGIRMIADTSLVYEPILEKYGYDSDDYRKSIDFYMNDPERFARILRTSGEIIDKKIAKLQHALKIEEARAKLPKIKSDFRPGDYVPYLADEPYVHFFDSLDVKLDSLEVVYHLVSRERADTIYDNLRMIILDSLFMDDSVPVLDSILVMEKLRLSIGTDSLRRMKVDTLMEMKIDSLLQEKVDTLRIKPEFIGNLKPLKETRLTKKDL